MKATVLLIDDDQDDADLLRLAFRRHDRDADLVVAFDGGEALAILAAAGRLGGRLRDLPTLVLLDLKLRGASGLEVLRRIRAAAETAALPVVVMTSSVERQDVDEAYAAGANAYVRKPDTFEELVTMTGTILEFWAFANETPWRRAAKEPR